MTAVAAEPRAAPRPPRLENLQELVTGVMVVLGAAATALAGGEPSMLVIGVGGFLFSYLGQVRRGIPRLTNRAGSILSVVAFGVLPIDILVLGSNPVLALIHVLLLVQLIRLCQEKKVRDHGMIYLMSLAQLGVSAVLSVDVGFAPVFLGFMLIGPWALLLLHMHSENERAATVAATTGQADISRSLAMVINGFSLFGLFLAVAFFLLFPRVRLNLMSQANQQQLSGFSEQVSIDEIGRIQENDDPVLQISGDDLTEQDASTLLLRGSVYDRYDDGRWKKSWQQSSAKSWLSGKSGSDEVVTFWLGRLSLEGRSVITVQPLGAPSSVVFHPSGAGTILFQAGTEPRYLERDPGGTLKAVDRDPLRAYQVRYASVDRQQARKRALRPVENGVDYRSFPAIERGPDKARLRKYAAQVFADAGANTAYERIVALESHLRETFRYTLDSSDFNPEAEPIEEFLYNQKKGHCEYFASAMVLLLRSHGMPARLVNGFKGGEWNRFGRFIQVRQKHAHAWVEVPFDQLGWVAFDPVAAAPELRAGDQGWFTELRRYLDALSNRWSSEIVGFDREQQFELIHDLRQQVKSGTESLQEVTDEAEVWVMGDRRSPPWGALLLITGGAGILVWVRSRKPGAKKRRAAGAPVDRGPAPVPPVEFYERMLAILAGQGIARPPHWTPQELARSVADEQGPAFQAVTGLTDAYYRVRYGGASLTPVETTDVERLLAELEGVVEASPGRSGA